MAPGPQCPPPRAAAPAVPSMAEGDFYTLAAPMQRSLHRFLFGAASFRGDPRLLNALETATKLQSVIQRDLLVECDRRYEGRHCRKVKNGTLRRRFARINLKVRELTLERDQLKARVSRNISTRWFVVAGLGNPGTSTRTVQSWCREVALGEAEAAPISHSSVAATRDAFGTLLLQMNKADVQRYVQTARHGFVVLVHQHDEATMRLRSTLPSGTAGAAVIHAVPPAAAPAARPTATPAAAPAAPPAAAPAVPPAASPYQRRGKSSKVQNAVVTVHSSSNREDSLRALVELRALGKRTHAP